MVVCIPLYRISTDVEVVSAVCTRLCGRDLSATKHLVGLQLSASPFFASHVFVFSPCEAETFGWAEDSTSAELVFLLVSQRVAGGTIRRGVPNQICSCGIVRDDSERLG